MKRIKIRDDTFSIPFAIIHKLDKKNEKKGPSILDISLKDGRKFKVVFQSADFTMFQKYVSTIESILNLSSPDEYFATLLFEKDPALELTHAGWTLYNMDEEFKRQGVENVKTRDGELKPFRFVKNWAGQEAQICDTYPKKIVVPGGMTDDDIVLCSRFRSRGRLPVLAYYYHPNDKIKATLWRSSQCKSGLRETRSEADETMLQMLGESCSRATALGGGTKPKTTLLIFDARPFINAMANKMGGKGYENTNYYKNAEISFMDIENIHAVRDSYKKIVAACEDLISDKFWSLVVSSGWCDHISSILTATKNVVDKSLKQGYSTLIHCSDGWDRTAQIVSLVQIMLDPYFRTLHGFQVLIEKDWISHGHQFKLRSGLRSKDEKDQRAPIFFQFLDCVHQMIEQFPFAFEFNIRFLSDLTYFSGTALFGTFLCNSLLEIEKHGINDDTISVWSFIESRKSIYINRLYDTRSQFLKKNGGEISPSSQISSIRFWREHFLYYYEEISPLSAYDTKLSSKWELFETIIETKNSENRALQDENEKLKKQLEQLMLENKQMSQLLERQKNNQNEATSESYVGINHQPDNHNHDQEEKERMVKDS